MTVRELREMLDTIDDSYKLSMRTPDGMEREITDASQEGTHFTFWADTSS